MAGPPFPFNCSHGNIWDETKGITGKEEEFSKGEGGNGLLLGIISLANAAGKLCRGALGFRVNPPKP